MRTIRDHILAVLTFHREEIRNRFGVKRLALFGSVARDETHLGSDVDVLVEFNKPATFDGYLDLKFFLEEMLENPVDLVTVKGLREELRPMVEREAIGII